MRAMLVTAGFGKRLAPLTDLLPKPAVPVCNRPIAWYAIDHLRRCGVRELVLNTHHLAGVLESAIRAAAPSDVSLSFVHEPEILGTAGGVRNAWQPIDGETFLVMNGKYVFAPDILEALRVHRSSGAIATMILKPTVPGDPLGQIEIDAESRVRRISGHGSAQPQATPHIYTGVSLFDARAHRDLPERGCLIRDVYWHWLDRGERVLAWVDTSSFRDVGRSHWHYWEANQALLTGLEHWPGIEPDGEGVLLGADAVIGAGAQLRASVIGPGAQISAGVTLERCVVWPGAHVEVDQADAIILPNGSVVLAGARSA
jgi:NDP-sugar pyrophosphorylase family protein